MWHGFAAAALLRDVKKSVWLHLNRYIVASGLDSLSALLLVAPRITGDGT